jgi:hypothetical protein
VNDKLLDLAHQCCDADAYLGLGYRCAQTNSCYDELRPIGDALWFSLPYRFGTGEVLLVYLQALLAAGVAYTLGLLIRKTASSPVRQITSWVLALAFLLWQIWPTFFNTLADTPASLFLIEGILLVLLAIQRQHGLLFFLAGLSLGSSALMRAAYFNPVCAAGTLFVLSWIYQAMFKSNQRCLSSLLILSFTIPMSWQMDATWKNMHQWSFLSADQTRTQLADHLQSAVVGYDTLLIESSYYWAPPCKPSKGVWNGLREGRMDDVYCLLSQRIFFYLGSYAPHTFYGNENKNLLSNGFAEDIGNLSAWSLHNLQSSGRSALSPAGDMKSSRLSPAQFPDDTEYYLGSTSVMPLHPGTYRYSIWLWVPVDQSPTSLDVQFLDKTLSSQTLDWNHRLLFQQTIRLTDQPRQFVFNISNPEPGYLEARLGIIGKPQATAAPDFFAWGAMLETDTTSTGYIRSHTPLYGNMGDAPENSGHERIFSGLLLLANTAIIATSFFYLWQCYRKSGSPAYFFVAALLALILGEALLILPEQRFLQGSLAIHGILSCLFFVSRAEQNNSRPNAKPASTAAGDTA